MNWGGSRRHYTCYLLLTPYILKDFFPFLHTGLTSPRELLLHHQELRSGRNDRQVYQDYSAPSFLAGDASFHIHNL